jgi:DNA-binding transcriptional ArsR family regulator
MANGGIARVLRTLHSKLRWDGTTLRIGVSYEEVKQPPSEELVLTPSVLGWPHLFGQVTDPTNAVLGYPAARVGAPHRDGVRGQALVDLLGESRAAVLLDLDLPRTTAQLSDRRQLAPATVSYHLGALVNAGLVLRKREGRQVLYARSTYGDLLLEAVFGTA